MASLPGNARGRRFPFILAGLSLFLTISGEALAIRRDPCPMAREMAIKGIDLFESEQDKGLNALVKAYEYCPEELAIGFNLGLAYYHADKRQEARNIWKKIHESFPNHVNTSANLAWVSFELGDDEFAHILSFQTLGKNPGHMALAHTKLYSLFRLGRYLEAYDWLTRAGLTGIKAVRWKNEAIDYVVETLWRSYREGEKEEALTETVLLLKDYPAEERLIQAKDQMARAFVDENAEVPFSIPLPHESWRTAEGLMTGRETLDEALETLPGLNPWEKRGDAYALLVGIQNYRWLPVRHFSDRDARNLKNLLVTRGVFQDKPANIRLRLDRTASMGSLKQDVEWFLTQGELNPNAAMVFYFSGHGLAISKTPGAKADDVLLLAADSPKEGLTSEHAISLKEFLAHVDRLPNEEVAVILDACFNDQPECDVSPEASPALDPALFATKKTLLLAAVEGVAQPFGMGKQHALTYYLLRGWMGEADGLGEENKDGWVSLKEAFALAKAKLLERGLPQDPLMSSEGRMRIGKTGGAR